MIAPDATQQRLDPIGGLASWPLAPVTAVIVMGYAFFSTLTQAGEVRLPLLTALALVSVGCAAGVLVWAALPESAPFQRRSTVIIVALALLGYLFEQAGMWGNNASVHDDFGQIGLGLLIMALAPFRPWREIAIVALISGLVVAGGALAQAVFLGDGVSAAVYAILAAVQLLAPALAGAAYCRQVVKSIRIWQTDAQRSIRLSADQNRGAAAAAIVAHRMNALDTTVLPFLDEVLQRGTVTSADIHRAHLLADEVRRRLVAETDHTWLDDLVAREYAPAAASAADPANSAPADSDRANSDRSMRPEVNDVERRAARFGPRQRAALGALLGVLRSHPVRVPGSVSVTVSGLRPEDRHGSEPLRDVTVVAVEASVALGERQLKALVNPFVAVLRVEFAHVRVAVNGHRLQLHLESPSGRPRTITTLASTRNES